MSALCFQCHGYGKTIPVNQALNKPNAVTFTDPTTVIESVCNVCLGNGYFAGSMV